MDEPAGDEEPPVADRIAGFVREGDELLRSWNELGRDGVGVRVIAFREPGIIPACAKGQAGQGLHAVQELGVELPPLWRFTHAREDRGYCGGGQSRRSRGGGFPGAVDQPW